MSSFDEIAEEYRRRRSGGSAQEESQPAVESGAPAQANSGQSAQPTGYDEIAAEYQRRKSGAGQGVPAPAAQPVQAAEPNTPRVVEGTLGSGRFGRDLVRSAREAAGEPERAVAFTKIEGLNNLNAEDRSNTYKLLRQADIVQRSFPEHAEQLGKTSWEDIERDSEYIDALDRRAASIRAFQKEVGADGILGQNAGQALSAIEELKASYDNRKAFRSQFGNANQYNAFMEYNSQRNAARQSGESYNDLYNRLEKQYADKDGASYRRDAELQNEIAQLQQEINQQGYYEWGIHDPKYFVRYTEREMEDRIAQLDYLRGQRETLRNQEDQELAYLRYMKELAKHERYADLPDAADWVQGIESGKAAYGELEKQIEQDRAQRVSDVRQGNTEIAGLSDEELAGEDWYTYRTPNNNWSEDQKSTWYYLYNRSPEEAYEYAVDVNYSRMLKIRQENLQRIQEWGGQNVVTRALATAANLVTWPTAVWDYMGSLAQYANTGLVMPETELSTSDVGDALTAGVAMYLNSEYDTLPEDIPVIGGKGWGDAYQLGMSIARSAETAALGGGLTNALFFGDAAKHGTQAALDRGATPGQALLMGFLNGSAEVLGETVSVESLINMDKVAMRSALVKIATQAGIEASEEGFTTLLNTWADALVMGDKSEINQRVQELISGGMAREEAQKKAWGEWSEGIAFDVLGGFISGGVGAGARLGARGLQIRHAEAKTAQEKAVLELLENAANTDEANGNDATTLAALEQIRNDRTMSRAFQRMYNTDVGTALSEFQEMANAEAPEQAHPAERETPATQPAPYSAVDALTGVDPRANAQTAQEAAGAALAQEGTETAETAPQNGTEQAQVFNSGDMQTQAQTDAPSQQNIDNTANSEYNILINPEMEGNQNVQRGSAEEAGRGVPVGEGSLGERDSSRGGPGGSSGVLQGELLSQQNANKILARKNPATNSGGVVVEFHDGSADTAAFCSALDAAKAADEKHGWMVDAKTPEGLANDGAKVYINSDGSAGFAINADGDIVAVFSNKNAGAPRGTTESMIPQALAAGGNKLDCFGLKLATIYAQHGFVPVARVQFDADYARDNIPGWTPEKGEPPIYFMMHNGDSVDTVVDNFGKYPQITQEQLDALPWMDYDKAYEYRDSLMAQRQTGKDGGGNDGGAGLTTRENNAPREQIAASPAEVHNDSGSDTQPGQKRSQTESNTLQHMAQVLGGEQDKLYYTPKSERESMTAALNRVNSDMNGEMQKLMDKEMWTGEDIDTALTIQGLLQMDGVNRNDFTAAQAWGRVIQAHGTESGRALQAFSKWSRTGAAVATQSMDQLLEAKDLSEEDRTRITADIYQFAQEFDGIEDGDLKSIRDLIKRQNDYRGTGTFRKKTYGQMLNEVQDFDWLKEYALRQMMNMASDYTVEADLGQKLKTIQVNNQLTRLGTFFRNLGGNGLFGVQDTLAQDGFGVALDALVGKFTGKRTVGFDKGWLSSDSRKGARAALVRSILEVAGDVDMGEGAGKYGNSANRTFKMSGGKVERFLSRWEQLLGYSLTSSDRFFRGAIEAESARSLADMDLSEEERSELGENQADYRLFQNKGVAYGISKGIHDLFNLAGVGGEVDNAHPQHGRQGGFGLGDLINPYPGVPANLAVKTLEYSPANIIKGGVELIHLLWDVKKGGDWSAARQQKAVMDMARGLSGVPLITLLTALLKSGVVRNSDDEDDKDAKALAAAEGRSGVQINLDAGLRWLQGDGADWKSGDTLMSIGWLEPMNGFLAVASLLAGEETDASLLSLSKDYVNGTVQGVLEMPVMQNIANIVKTYDYSKAEDTSGKMLDAAAGLAGDALSGLFIPAPVSQTARAMDPYYRETTGDDAADTAMRRLMNAIPGLRGKLPVKMDNFGNPKEYGGSAYDRWMNSFVRPGAITDYHASDMAQALDALYEKTGDADVYPDRKAPGSFTYESEKITLSADEKRKYQWIYGQAAQRLYTSILLDKDFQNLSDGERVWLLSEAKSYSAHKARQAVMAGRGESYENRDMEKIDTVAATGVDVVDYLLGQKNANTDGKSGLSNQEVYNWLLGTDYSDEQKNAIWEANRGSSNKSWQEYYDANPVSALIGEGKSLDEANRIVGEIDANGKNGISQDELWDWYVAHPEQENLIAGIWGAKGYKKSWEDYKRKNKK